MTTRRTFLKVAGFCSLPVLLNRSVFADSDSYDVIVIGAGVSGLSAAQSLIKRGLKVLVLEASNRVGGRTFTDYFLDKTPIDLGASWIQGSLNNPIKKLADENKIELIGTDYDNKSLFIQDKGKVTKKDLDKLEALLKNIGAHIGEFQNNSDKDVPLSQVLSDYAQKNSLKNEDLDLLNYVVASEIEYEYAADTKKLSCLYFDQGKKLRGEDFVFKSGYINIVNVLKSGLNIKINNPVNEINYASNMIKIKTKNSEYVTKKVIVSVSLGCLKKNLINFVPSLPEKKITAIDKIGMGLLNKYWFHFKELFWDKDSDVIAFVPKQKGEWVGFLNFYKYTGKPILLGFNSGDYALELENKTDIQIKQAALNVLNNIFPNKVTELTEFKFTRWANEKYYYGSYSYLALGSTPEMFDSLAEDVNGKIYFAGEATHKEFNATVQGAYFSGIREAKKIISSLFNK